MVENGHTRRRLVLLLASHFTDNQGGAELQAKYIAEKAVSRGLDVHYIYLSYAPDAQLHECNQVVLHPIQRRMWPTKLGNITYPYFPVIYRLLSRLQPDVIYQRCGSGLTGVAAYYSRRRHCPFVFHVASDRDLDMSMPSARLFYRWPERWLVQYGIRSASRVVVQTKDQKRAFDSLFPAERGVVIPNGHPVPDVSVRKLSGRPMVLWVANFRPVKSPELFIQLATSLHRHIDADFVMVGKVGAYHDLVSAAERDGIIRSMGEMPACQVDELFSQARLLVNTSQQEGFSNTFIQAWMREVPVISLKVDPGGVIKQHSIGLVSGNMRKMEEDVAMLLQNKELCCSMGRQARLVAEKEFSLHRIDDVVDLIEEESVTQ